MANIISFLKLVLFMPVESFVKYTKYILVKLYQKYSGHFCKLTKKSALTLNNCINTSTKENNQIVFGAVKPL